MTSPSETIEKAMEGLRHAPGPWEVESEKQDDLSPKHDEFALHNADGYRMCGTENADWRFSEIVTDGPDEDGFFSDWNDPAERLMKYIAACSPDRMRVVLDELYALREIALKLEAMKREMAEKHNLKKVVNAVLTWADQRCPCHNEQPNPCPLCGASVENLEPCKSAENTIPRHLLADLRRARTLIQGEKP